MTGAAYANHSARARRLAGWLDATAGPLAGLASRAWGQCVSAAGSGARGAGTDAERILLLRCDHIGDLLMTTPAIRALRRARPLARIALLCAPGSAEAVRDNPDLDEILTMEAPWYELHSGRETDPSGVLSTVARLLCLRFDATIEMRGDARMILLAAAAGAGRRIGFGNLGLGAALTDPVPLDRDRSHAARAFDLLGPLGVPVPAGEEAVRPVFIVPEAARMRAARLLEGVERLPREGASRDGNPLVVVAPASNRPSHTWAAARFAQAAGQLVQSGGRVVLTARSGEAAVTGAVACAMKSPVLDLTGRTDLATLGAILARADLLLANDSGTVHLAAAVGCPVVALFGPTSPALSFPYSGFPGSRALAGPTACARPCFTAGCPDTHGWNELTVERVVEACRALIGDRFIQRGPRA